MWNLPVVLDNGRDLASALAFKSGSIAVLDRHSLRLGHVNLSSDGQDTWNSKKLKQALFRVCRAQCYHREQVRLLKQQWALLPLSLCGKEIVSKNVPGKAGFKNWLNLSLSLGALLTASNRFESEDRYDLICCKHAELIPWGNKDILAYHLLLGDCTQTFHDEQMLCISFQGIDTYQISPWQPQDKWCRQNLIKNTEMALV